jgi:hypothetical protein
MRRQVVLLTISRISYRPINLPAEIALSQKQTSADLWQTENHIKRDFNIKDTVAIPWSMIPSSKSNIRSLFLRTRMYNTEFKRTSSPNLLLLTYAWSWGLLEKLSIVQPLKNFPAFYGTRRFITALTRALHWSLSWARSIQSPPSHHPNGLLSSSKHSDQS